MARAPGAAGPEQSFCADLGENSLRILEADYQRYVILHMQSSRNGTASQVLALYGTAARPRGGAGLARPPPQQPVASWGRGPKLLSTGRFPELKSSFLDRFDKACKSHGLGPEKIIRFSNQGRRQGLPRQQPGPARRSRARGVGMGAQGLGWGRDLRQSLSESLTVFSDPCYARSRYPSRPSGA